MWPRSRAWSWCSRWLVAIALVATVPLARAAGEPSRDRAVARQIELVVVSVQLPSWEHLRPELELRAPAVKWHAAGVTVPRPAGLAAHLQVRQSEDGTPRFHLELVIEDGRAYERDVDASEQAPARALATALAHLLAGIAADDVAPDREAAPVPEPLTRTITPPPPIPNAPRTTEVPPPTRAPVEPAPRVWLTPQLGAGLVVGLGSPRARTRLAGGGSIDVAARFRSGAVVSGGVRMIGTRDADLSLVRARFALGGGYELLRRRFALQMLARLSAEPWGVRDPGGRAQVRDREGRRALPGPLVGAAILVAPALRFPTAAGPAWRVGLQLELAGTAVIDQGLGVPTVARLDTPDRVQLRAGGLELGAGIHVGLELPIVKR